MADDRERPDPSAWRAEVLTLVSLALAVLLLATCVAAPVVVARLVNPWLGLLVAVGSLGVWVQFGPRPMPGFVPGILCLSGLAALLATFIACGIVAVRSLFG